MNSFTKKLVLNCTGVIFVSFVIVYFLFNLLVSNYIRAQAERELAVGMRDVVGFTEILPAMGWQQVDADIPIATGISPSIRLDSVIPSEMFEFEFRRTWEDMPVEIEVITTDGVRMVSVERFIPMQEGQLIVEGLIPTTDATETEGVGGELVFHGFRPIRQPSLVSVDVIMINESSEILSPNVEFLSDIKRAEVEFLVNYYTQNSSQFTNHEMRRVSGANNTYYVSTTTRPLDDSSLSILMYTDISSAMVFTNTMNRILGLLLAVSAILSLAISISMSARFKRAIVGLCNYADTIGRGNFTEKAGVFKDTEFNQLSKSMNNMSNMLQTYESNQKQFFQNVSHELRTPLMSIQGYAEGILKDIFTKEEAAGVILSEGHKMADLVGELLYVSRMDSATPLNITSLSIKNLLYECCERVKPIAQNCGKQITTETLDEEIFINADEEKLERAIINILSNAIRYAKSHVKIKYETAGETLQIKIEDDGSGISPEDLPNIFERFYKGENGNYGLGLAISKDIIKSFGGSISAENKTAPETGAVFTVVLKSCN